MNTSTNELPPGFLANLVVGSDGPESANLFRYLSGQSIIIGMRIHFPSLVQAATSDELSKAAAERELKERFNGLASTWEEETALHSSRSAIVSHPAYQASIGIGEKAVPTLLEDLYLNRRHWFDALEAITGENPVREDQRGQITQMIDAWIDWGERAGHYRR